jgi:uncharacterized delta-60 repeat protein
MVCAASSSAANLDRSFGQNGTVVTKTGNPPYGASLTDEFTGNVWAIAEDKQGRLLAVGGTGSDSLVVRYLSDGRLDPSFGDGGKAQFPAAALGGTNPEKWSNRIRAVSVLPGGKILLAGEEARIDSSFARSPKQYFMRLFPNGMRDLSFANFPNFLNGPPKQIVLPDPGGALYDMFVQRDGRFTITGMYSQSFNGKNRNVAYVRRFMPEILGPPENSIEFDPSFAPRSEPFPHSTEIYPSRPPFWNAFRQIELLGSGKTLVAGNLRNRYFVGRLTRTGEWDRTFGINKTGKVVTEIPNSKGKACFCAVGSGMARDSKGRIYQTGWSFPDYKDARTINLLRFRPNGLPDRSFGRAGKAKLTVNQFIRVRRMAVHPNGTIFVAAWLGYQSAQKFAVFAFRPDGRPLRSFFHKGRYISPIGEISTAEDILIDRQGRLVVSGGTFKDGDASFVIKRFRVGQ